MVVDTSALIAILRREPVAERLEAAMLTARRVSISAATLVEASIVSESKGQNGGMEDLDLLLDQLHVDVVPLTREHAVHARQAFLHFGKGRHPAGLNFGDCFSYALSRTLGEPLLFVGNDFSRTDVEPALY